MTTWIFDVDGVLCDTGCEIDSEFKAWFLEWSKDKTYHLVTGGERENTIKQLGNEIVENATMAFHCMGNYVVLDGEHYKINQFTLSTEEYEWLFYRVRDSQYPIRTGSHINQRAGSLNFSVLGRNATLEQKLQYLEWDNVHNERKAIIQDFTKKFPRFEAYVGGNASIDICLRECNKSQILDVINYDRNGLYFFGDKCFDGGIDQPLAGHVKFMQYGTVVEVHGYKQTWEQLLKL